jgi:hypothetical protein
MTFIKWAALMLLDFTLFVGYQAYTKHERCVGLDTTMGTQATASQRQRAYDRYTEVCR